MRLIIDSVSSQRGRFFLWLPVAYGLGIAVFFMLRAEPGGIVYAVCAIGVLTCLYQAYGMPAEWRPIAIGPAICMVGFLVAGAHAHLVQAPVLEFRYYGPVEGRIVTIDRSQSDKLRLTLDQVVLHRVDPERTPLRVRVSLHGEQEFLAPEPGQTVVMTAHLSPPQGPVEPGGFDFRRLAWFQELGAVGYTRTPALMLVPAEGGPAWWLSRLRFRLAVSLRRATNDEAGAVAAAIITGDRSALSPDTVENLRRTNLAHLLAISGLHMGLLVGFVFAALRYSMALIPHVSLYYPTKKIAAFVALLCGLFYLLLSGAQVATLRAFIMVAVMLIAVMLDRRAITLRSVAIAALIVLTLRPNGLMEPGFQMSFAATTALVSVFDGLRDWRLLPLPRWGHWVAATVLSSLVAGVATAPFAAVHFNQLSHYGLIANLLAVPVMGVVVMPAAVLAGLLWLIGAQGVALWGMSLGINWILLVAQWIAGWDGVVSHVVSPVVQVLPIFTISALILVLWKGHGRWMAIVGLITAVFLWWGSERPDVLISESGGLIGVHGAEGRALSKARGDGFSARVWLENDGAPVEQAIAASRPGMIVQEWGREVELAGRRIIHLQGKSGIDYAAKLCTADAIIIYRSDLDTDGPCLIFDARALRQSGSVAIYASSEGLRIVTVAEAGGQRLWSRP